MNLSVKELAHYVDHTLLRPEATTADVQALVAEALDLGVYAICVSPSHLPLAIPRGAAGEPMLAVATVCGFPSGAHAAQVKAAEAALAVAAGANEVDMVINLGAVKDTRWEVIADEIAQVRAAVDRATPGSSSSRRTVKVIIESAALTDVEIVKACQTAIAHGADMVKTSTGFHPAGGASTHAVRLMAHTVGRHYGVKASGGIRTWADAMDMIEAGATRLGLSSTRSVLAGRLPDAAQQ